VRTSPAPQSPQPAFVVSVLWSWLGLAASLISGLVLTPFMLRKVGATGYGVWTLVFALAESYWVFDFGIRSATTHFSARYRAVSDDQGLNELINTSLAYFAIIALLFLAVIVAAVHLPERLLHIPPTYAEAFRQLLLMVGVGWAATIVLVVFDASLEGMQRFDILSRIGIAAALLRSVGSILLLSLGGSIVAVGAMTIATQLLASLATCITVMRLNPALRFGRRYVKVPMFRQLAWYGGPALAVSVSNRVIVSMGPLIIGHFLSAAWVTYYAVPFRLVQLILDPVTRIGMVIRSRVAAMAVQESRNGEIAQLVIFANRYSLVLMLGAAIVLFPFGERILGLWATRDLAAHSSTVLRVLIAGAAMGMGAQFSSGAVLFALGRHRIYSIGVVAEALGGALIMSVTVPRAGVVGAAFAYAQMTFLVRGLFTSWLLCRYLKTRWVDFLGSIYLLPLAVAMPIASCGWVAQLLIPGMQKIENIIAFASLLACVYLVLAFRFCLIPEHRVMLLDRAQWALRVVSTAPQ
jgi:O-antigen/teichoic acid export membrane protein